MDCGGCPEEFQENCRYYEIQCHICAAVGKGDRFFYQPLSKDIPLSRNRHPHSQHIKASNLAKAAIAKRAKKASIQSTQGKAARKMEVKVLRSIGARSTANSGATFNDGDGFLVVDGVQYNIEHKHRPGGRNCLGPTPAEWDKGKAQGVEVYITTSSEHGSVVTMPLDTLKSLLGI